MTNSERVAPRIELSDAELVERPFPHFVATDCLDPESAGALLAWLEHEAPWRMFADEFYEFEGLNFHDTRLPAEFAYLISDSFLSAVRADLERIFRTALGGRAGIAAQRMVPGRTIGVHTDFGPQRQTHRLV